MPFLFLEHYKPIQGILNWQLPTSGYYGLIRIHSEDIWNSTYILRHSRWNQWGGKKGFWSDENKEIFTPKLTNLRPLHQTSFKLVIINITYTLFASLHKVSWWTLSISESYRAFRKTDLKSHHISSSLCQGKRAEPMPSIAGPSKGPRSERTWKLLSFH